MKRIICLFVLGLTAVSLCACGAGAEDPTETETQEVSTTEIEESTTVVFDYMVDALPQGWTISEKYSTPTYLEADWGEGEDAPHMTVSVFSYDDPYGYGKTQALAAAVKAREKESSEVAEDQIGGLAFLYLAYPSPTNNKLLRYEFYGQTQPDAKNNYKFVVITLENVKDEKQFKTLRTALDAVDFPFAENPDAAASTTAKPAATTKAAATTAKPETTTKAAAATTKPAATTKAAATTAKPETTTKAAAATTKPAATTKAAATTAKPAATTKAAATTAKPAATTKAAAATTKPAATTKAAATTAKPETTTKAAAATTKPVATTKAAATTAKPAATTQAAATTTKPATTKKG